jgi:hypothetical protein
MQPKLVGLPEYRVELTFADPKCTLEITGDDLTIIQNGIRNFTGNNTLNTSPGNLEINLYKTEKYTIPDLSGVLGVRQNHFETVAA